MIEKIDFRLGKISDNYNKTLVTLARQAEQFSVLKEQSLQQKIEIETINEKVETNHKSIFEIMLRVK